MRSFLIIGTILCLTVLGSLPLAFAQTEGSYRLLAPLEGTGIGNAVPLTTQGLTNYLKSAFNLGIGIAIALAVVMIVIGGFQYLSTDAVFGKEEGRGKLTHAVGGLILALGIYLILETINPNILNLSLTIPAIPRVTSDRAGFTGGFDNAQINEIFTKDAEVRTRLQQGTGGGQGNVSVHSPACTPTARNNCTSVGGLPSQTVQRLIALKTICDQTLNTNCNIRVSGGTEYWEHEPPTHGPGIRTVDLDASPELNRFLYASPVGPPQPIPNPIPPGTEKVWENAVFTYKTSDGRLTTRHWHVTGL